MQAPHDPEKNWIEVWDIPTRFFHWLLMILVTVCFVTAKLGGNAMTYHISSGLGVLGLLIFRLIWGIIGSQTARFSQFIRSPMAAWRYGRSLMKNSPHPYLGHNPLGGWSILAMLLGLLLQATTGLFANDEIFTHGPLYAWVSDATSGELTHIHLINQGIILGLVSLHVLAVVFYFGVKHENLILPMITGRKSGMHFEETQIKTPPMGVALLALAFSALIVYLIGK
ncbi:Cytochrome b561 family protein 1 [Desulfosarcina cetonica]|uniref:cytochrome b/b6 domain-containing protein n=1 Tax=Desulfosarcina cetonica TaxID=90730 RepID=UPI0006D2A37C|nr:cytochrome b/b6 domain-containing protein [Desulfosarcina cetonica]VTR69054.1 Cytochrome b561 family protein 1 [Desulfosarcina cetonica]